MVGTRGSSPHSPQSRHADGELYRSYRQKFFPQFRQLASHAPQGPAQVAPPARAFCQPTVDFGTPRRCAACNSGCARPVMRFANAASPKPVSVNLPVPGPAAKPQPPRAIPYWPRLARAAGLVAVAAALHLWGVSSGGREARGPESPAAATPLALVVVPHPAARPPLKIPTSRRHKTLVNVPALGGVESNRSSAGELTPVWPAGSMAEMPRGYRCRRG